MVLTAPPPVDADTVKAETLRCQESVAYFLDTYGRIYDPQAQDWIAFALWAAQYRVLRTLLDALLVVILKSRQLGLTWLILGYILWRMLFYPAQSVLLFSRREHEAWHLLERLIGMYDRLPAWLQVPVLTANSSVWTLANGSTARAFPTNAGDSYTATIVLADEFDLVEDQDRLLGSIKPTIDAGGQLILLSRVNKRTPLSAFKRIYQGAVAGLTAWVAIFLPWSARPDRDAAWYAAQEADVLQRTGAKDDLYEQYPATDTEALAPPALAKRFPADWILKVQAFAPPITPPGAPALADLVIYTPPQAGHTYVIGADPAEGNPTSDESAAIVGDKATGAMVALLAGKIEPSTFGQQLATLAAYYADAGILCERNNHGHAVLAQLFRPLRGSDGRDGWLTTGPAKARMYDNAAVAIREGDGTVADPTTWHQLAGIDGNTLSAPAGLHDDRATAWALMQQARLQRSTIGGV